MKPSLRCFWAACLSLALLLSSCSFSPASPEPTKNSANAVLTAAALTAQARLTELALTTPSPEASTSTPTETSLPIQSPITTTLPVSGTASSPVGTGTPALTQTTPQPTNPPAVTQAPASGDRVEFVADMTIPDGTAIDAGAKFTKTWRLKNIGTTTWTAANYTLVHVSNDAIEGPAKVSLPSDVAPGQTIDVSVELTAPGASGKHTSYWKLSNDRGQLFGIGPNATEAFYVQITVGGSASSTEVSTTETPTNGTPAPTSTQGSSSELVISDLSTSIEDPTFSGACSHRYNVTAVFTLNKPTTITYQLEAGSDTPGFSFSLPAAQTSSFGAGTQTLVFYLDLTNSGDGWIRLHISSPVDVRSGKANFSLTCK